MRAAACILFVAALLAPADASAQELYEQPVGFAELLRARIDIGTGMAQLPQVIEGKDLDRPAVFLTIDRHLVYLHGEPLLRLEHGLPTRDSLRMCKAKLPCSPVLRRAIAEARSALTAAFRIKPAVVIIAPVQTPYPTLLLVARSAAEAGASLSIYIAARTKGGDVVGAPVLVAPGRTLVFGPSQKPLLATVDLHGRAVTVNGSRVYLEQAARPRNLADMQETLGRLQLRSGRHLCFVTADAPTTVGEVVAVIDAAREIFPHIAITDRQGVRAAMTR